MAKRRTPETRGSDAKTDRRLRAAYEKSRAEFSAADLQKFTEIEEGVPVEDVLADLEATHRRLARKKI